MNTVCEKNKCNGCNACVEVCPKNCIRIVDEFRYLNAVRDINCVNCHICEKICPRNTMPKKIVPKRWYQGWTNEDFRKESSSGGIAASLSYEFIKRGGYVASCIFRDGSFIFDITNDTKDIQKFAGSKYVKSNPQGIIKKIENRLKYNPVLFIGLPCQVASLKNSIKNQKNLFTVDLICHGTPSVKLLELFLSEHGISLNDVKKINFREKKKMGLSIDGKRLCQEDIDDYMITFLSSINYTLNCYYCDYASFDRISDITLGDSWGTEFKNELVKGVSLILIQNEKGENLIDGLDLNLSDVDIKYAIDVNEQLRKPCQLSHNRDKFFKYIENGKTFSFSTFMIFKRKIIKRIIKNIVYKIIKR